MRYQQVINFWFDPQHQPLWFKSNDQFDNSIRLSFLDLWSSACKGELFHWRNTAEGRLAEIIVLDQFSRNLNRGSALSYRQDGMALILSQELISQPEWQHLSTDRKAFSLLPWMHSESPVIHQQAHGLFATLDTPSYLAFEIKHSETIQRFGRYPHRNSALGRPSTPEEIDWMEINSGF